MAEKKDARGESGESEAADLEVTGTAKYKDGPLAVDGKVRAVGGLYAGAVCCAGALAWIFLWGDVQAKVGHLVMAVISSFVAGAFVNAGVTRAHMNDLRRETAERRAENRALAADLKKCHESLLKQVRSSQAPPPPAPSPSSPPQLPPAPSQPSKTLPPGLPQGKKGKK